jgi:hypothetical protein
MFMSRPVGQVRHIDRERDRSSHGSAVVDSARRHPSRAGSTAGQAGIQRAVAPPMLRGQGQFRQRPHRPIRVQHHVGQLEQDVHECGQRR